MKHRYLFALSVTLLGLAFSKLSVAAGDCPNTAWQKSNGRTCANLGLDSKRPVCKGGQFATACDDTRKQIRTCRSNLVCDNRSIGGYSWNNWPDRGWSQTPPTRQNFGGRSWQQDGNDYILYRGKQFHCTEWNYRKKRPCKSGRINEDCRGGC